MTSAHWFKLRRGTLIRHKDHPHHIHTVLAANRDAPALLITITGIASNPEEWDEVTDDGDVIRDDGTITAGVEMACLMCRGTRFVPKPGTMEMADCPRCKGDGAEPKEIDESIIEIRLFYPTAADEFPQMVLTARTKYDPAQLAEMLERAARIFKEGLPPEEKLMVPTGMVN